MDEETMSPPVAAVVSVSNERPLLNFPAAILYTTTGKRISRVEWNNADYGFIDSDGFLKIYKDNQVYFWKLNDGDILGEDWVVLETASA